MTPKEIKELFYTIPTEEREALLTKLNRESCEYKDESKKAEKAKMDGFLRAAAFRKDLRILSHPRSSTVTAKVIINLDNSYNEDGVTSVYPTYRVVESSPEVKKSLSDYKKAVKLAINAFYALAKEHEVDGDKAYDEFVSS